MDPGRVLQLNISSGGVPKTPISRGVVDQLGIAGDKHRFKFHGGPQKAILLFASEVIDVLRQEGWPLFYGALGENITTVGVDHKSWRPGQILRVGSVTLKLTTPRQPCATLDAYGPGIQQRLFDARVKALDPSSEFWGMSGFYASVVQGGIMEADDIIESLPPAL